MKWVEIIESHGHLNVTKRELETAPEGTLFPIKFCADTSNITDDSKWVLPASIAAAASASVVAVSSVSKKTKKANMTMTADTATPATDTAQTTAMQQMLGLAQYIVSHANSDLDDNHHANAIINVSFFIQFI